MKKEQRICVLLAIMILGIWGLEAKSSGSLIPKSWKIRMIQSVQENAERLYMPGVTYTEKKQGEIRVTEAVVHMASALIPLGNYVTEREAAELLTEDEATYAILAKKQAEEENSVDENGQLIGKDKSEETRQASVPTMDLSMERLNDFEYLVSNFYTVDSSTMIGAEQLNVDDLLGRNMKIGREGNEPKILIFHTHSQETFVGKHIFQQCFCIYFFSIYRSQASKPDRVSEYGLSQIHRCKSGLAAYDQTIQCIP